MLQGRLAGTVRITGLEAKWSDSKVNLICLRHWQLLPLTKWLDYELLVSIFLMHWQILSSFFSQFLDHKEIGRRKKCRIERRQSKCRTREKQKKEP